MPSAIFKNADRSYLVAAIAELTHPKLDALEFSVDLPETQGTKDERVTAMLRRVFSEPNTDELLVQILDHIFLSHWARSSANYATLDKRVLSVRGVVRTDDGFVLPSDVTPPAGSGFVPTAASNTDSTWSAGTNWGVPPTTSGTATTTAKSESEGMKVITDKSESEGMKVRDKNKVFIVHGRDTAAKETVETFLHFLSLGTISWREAVSLTGKSQPHTYDIVKAGMDHAAAIIVLFTPDDEARVKEQFSTPGDPDRKGQGQARQNVILEAGMAFAYAQECTVFVQGGRTRPISDIEGFNWVKLDGEYESRADLRDRLLAAGAQIHQRNENLAHYLAGTFKATS